MKLSQFFIIFTLSILNFANAVTTKTISENNLKNSTVKSEALEITRVTLGQMVGDIAGREFSTIITLNNKENNITDWKFGFYMPRRFNQIKTTNINLSMQICEKDTDNCSALVYQKTPFSSADLSIGFTTVLAPQKPFPLLIDKTYIISLLHNNQHSPLNYSAVPQSFFITHDKQTEHLNTKLDTYILTDYNPKLTANRIKQHIQKNWENSSQVTSTLNLVPSPTKVTFGSGYYELKNNLAIHDLMKPLLVKTTQIQSMFINKSKQVNANFIKDALASDLSIISKIDNKSTNDGIVLQQIEPKQLNNNLEGYKLTISDKNIVIEAANSAGIFYGFETLRQLLDQYGTKLPILSITDYPRFKYRGILLDVARHYFTPVEVKHFLEIMATHKLNTLHLHLSDSDAFRVFLSDYPELTAVGATRGLGQPINGLCLTDGSLDITNFIKQTFPSIDTSYKGFYSANDIKDLIEFANARQITIIPEIDIPAHARAMMKALPDALYDATDISSTPSSSENTLPICLYNSKNPFGQKFTSTINRIVNQVAILFNKQTTLYQQPNEVSIGGDEVSLFAWTEAPNCNNDTWKNLNAMQKEHLFLKKLSQDKTLKQVKLSGWQDFVQHDSGELSELNINASQVGHVWMWRTSKPGIINSVILANHNYPVVLDYADLTYFDISYTPEKTEPGLYWSTSYSDTYAALNSAIAASKTVDHPNLTKPQNILGLEGALWTDVIPEYNHLIYMTLPKMAGLAEAAWSDAAITTKNNLPNWLSLAKRLGCGQDGFLNYLNKQYNVRYRGFPEGIKLEAPQLCKKP